MYIEEKHVTHQGLARWSEKLFDDFSIAQHSIELEG
jgi:hypothetical protein